MASLLRFGVFLHGCGCFEGKDERIHVVESSCLGIKLCGLGGDRSTQEECHFHEMKFEVVKAERARRDLNMRMLLGLEEGRGEPIGMPDGILTASIPPGQKESRTDRPVRQ